jgi:hypothetical protein
MREPSSFARNGPLIRGGSDAGDASTDARGALEAHVFASVERARRSSGAIARPSASCVRVTPEGAASSEQVTCTCGPTVHVWEVNFSYLNGAVVLAAALFAGGCSAEVDGGVFHRSALSQSGDAGTPGQSAGGNGAGGSTTADAGDAADSGPWTEAPHPAAPQIQNDPGWQGPGPVLTTPVFTAVTFPDYDLTADVERFVSTLGSSAYWASAVGSYGVGTPSVTAPVRVSAPPPTTLDDADVSAWITRELTTTADLPPASENSVYILFYPRSVTLMAFGETACISGGFTGYHYSTKVAGQDVAFVVVPECGATESDSLRATTLAASHEIAETVTDPHPESEPTTWQRIDQDHRVWELAMGGNGEVGDMCQGAPGADFVPPGFGFTVQRIWSNASAAAGHDPCQPALPGESAYFSAAARLPDQVSIFGGSSKQLTSGVKIPVGGSGTVEVDLFSDAPAPAWTVTAEDLSPDGNQVTFSWEEGSSGGDSASVTGKNGDKLHLSIHVVGTDASLGGTLFRIRSRQGSTLNDWYGFVGQS